MSDFERMKLLRELRELGAQACALLREMTADLRARQEETDKAA